MPPGIVLAGVLVVIAAAPGEADGVVPAGLTVFDDQYPAVANLDPALLTALHRTATGAGSDGVELYVDSGWRLPKYQEQLLDEAISNEPWHFELRPEAVDHGCPPMYADPTHDPRMQQ